jgi:uncharacterized protein (DUF305 family)
MLIGDSPFERQWSVSTPYRRIVTVDVTCVTLTDMSSGYDRQVSIHRRGYMIAGAIAITIVTTAVAFGLRGAEADPDASASPSPTSSPVPVVVPGKPGESASVVPSDQLKAPDGSKYNSLDVWFVRMMIPHHQQALEIAALAPARAKNPQIKAVASRITAAQGPEIDAFRAWLSSRNLPEKPDETGHDHAGMRGMQPPEAMRGLATLNGELFDKVFVDMLVSHHQGAVAMCTDLLKIGADERLIELATGIAAEQQAEISRMHDIVKP